MPNAVATNYDGTRSVSFAQVPTGGILFANGVDKPQFLMTSDTTSVNSGIPAGVSSGMTVIAGGSGGAITGNYKAAVRYIDTRGTPGDLSDVVAFTASSNVMVSYMAIPAVPSGNPRVVTIELWRTTADQEAVFYLDGTVPVGTSFFSSTKTDDDLLDSTPLPVVNTDGTPSARRFGVPPDWKSVVVSHQERTFWGVNAVISDGHASVANGSATVVVHGAHVPDNISGRLFLVPGDSTEYTISAASSGTLTIDPAYAGLTDPFSPYEVIVSHAENNRIYFSGLGEPEAVPLFNAVDLVVNEIDGGSLSSMLSLGSFIWPMTQNRIYRWTYQVHPSGDGAIYLSANRGCLNQRCWTLVDGNAYIIDREGCYIFNGGTVQSISDSIQDLFRPGGGIVWDNSKWFHVSNYYLDETVKFFVCLDGSQYPRHALCYNFRVGNWWIEEYPWTIGSSDVLSGPDSSRLLVGSTQSRVMLTSHEYLDGAGSHVDDRYSVTSAGIDYVVCDGLFTSSDVYLAPVVITKGLGKGQIRLVYYYNSTTGRLLVDSDWDIIPDATSEIQIGGIPWKLVTKDFRLSDVPEEQSRKCSLSFTPVDKSTSMNVSVFENREDVAENYDIDYDRLDGAQVFIGSPLVEIDLTDNEYGWVYWSFDSQNDYRGPAVRYIAIGLSGVSNDEQTAIHQMTIEGVK